jgi:hypothetical protein
MLSWQARLFSLIRQIRLQIQGSLGLDVESNIGLLGSSC